MMLLLSALTAVMITGCSPFTRKPVDQEMNKKANVITKMDDLADGGFYIYHNNVYEELYVKNANYELSDTMPLSSNAKHTLWFGDDWKNVPTMFNGDLLIYKDSEELDEVFCIERFYYIGSTIGISNLERLDSGRYSINLDPDKMNVDIESDAENLMKLQADSLIIDKVGGEYLRDGNVSNGGCVLGLEAGNKYQAEVYAGTYMHKLDLTADVIALTSMELYKSSDYEFLESEIISIEIPEYFNSGYYLVNNFGLLRYVKGTSYDDTTDFNIPNVEPENLIGNATD